MTDAYLVAYRYAEWGADDWQFYRRVWLSLDGAKGFVSTQRGDAITDWQLVNDMRPETHQISKSIPDPFGENPTIIYYRIGTPHAYCPNLPLPPTAECPSPAYPPRQPFAVDGSRCA